MSLLPEQQRALAYVRTRGTAAPVGQIRDKVAATFAALESLLAGLDEREVARRPAPASWSVQEVVDHLVESERPAVDQLAALLAGSSSEQAIPAGLQSAAPLELPWASLVAELAAVHQRLLALLASAGESTPLEATAAVEMVVKCEGAGGRPVHWIEAFDWKAFALLLHAHEREHVDQVRRALAALAAADAPGTPGAP